MEELDILITKTPFNKSPGPDGFPFEFYRSFWSDIKYLILDVFKQCLDRGELSESMKQGLITLIPKPNKDKNVLDNWRPITLLNSDYKILAAVYAGRLKPCLEEVISPTQSGFMKGRHISNNIRLVLDLLDYSELVNDDALILFLDFYKAFDTVEHAFMYDALRRFGFGPKFVRTVQTLYKNINSNVSLSNGTSPRFVIGRGIRQGCPISSFLFLLVAELLNLYIVHCSNIEGIQIADRTILISQLADDTCIFLKDKKQVPIILETIKLFSDASGLSVNQSKSEIMTIHHSNIPDVCGIKIKQKVRYLGILIDKSPHERVENNFSTCLQKAKIDPWACFAFQG
ncbi:MAG: RNA-directed DNA polymerase [Brevinema sp.]